MPSSTFRPRHGEDAYPTGRLIIDRAMTLEISRTDLVHRLGFKNASKGHRALTTALLHGLLSSPIRENLATALEVDPAMVAEALVATVQQHRDEAQARREADEIAYHITFEPHLRCEVERPVPFPIFAAAMFGVATLRLVPIPERIQWADEPTRDELVKEAILDHYRQRHGEVPTFGKITGYMLILRPGDGVDVGLAYSIDGIRLGEREVERLGTATLSVEGRQIPSSIFRQYGRSRSE